MKIQDDIEGEDSINVILYCERFPDFIYLFISSSSSISTRY